MWEEKLLRGGKETIWGILHVHSVQLVTNLEINKVPVRVEPNTEMKCCRITLQYIFICIGGTTFSGLICSGTDGIGCIYGTVLYNVHVYST